jgi:hypothetical protein
MGIAEGLRPKDRDSADRRYEETLYPCIPPKGTLKANNGMTQVGLSWVRKEAF